MEWTNDTELFRLMRERLFTAIIGDVLDLHGCRDQLLPPECRPLRPNMIVCGRAMTVHEMDVDEPTDPPFGLMLKALDSLQQNEVYVAAGASPQYALWGELMSTAARARGAAGAVMAGYTRDANGILAMDFPVFGYGSYAQDQRGRGKVVDFRATLNIGSITIRPGDIVFGDIDGGSSTGNGNGGRSSGTGTGQGGENRQAAAARRRVRRKRLHANWSAVVRQWRDHPRGKDTGVRRPLPVDPSATFSFPA